MATGSMPRKPIVRSNEHYYHITARSNNRENFYVAKERMWKIMIHEMKTLQEEYDLKLAGMVLMDNHFHLLLLTPKIDIDRVMFFFMRRVSLKIQKYTGRINRIYGARYKGCLIDNPDYLHNVYKYLYRNPVRAGLCRKIQDYTFSSWKMKELRIENPLYAHQWSDGELKWLNEEFEFQKLKQIRFSLQKTVFDTNPNFRPR